MRKCDTAARGAFGRPVGWYEYEIDLWIHNRIRAATGQPALPPPAPAQHPVILRERDVLRRTGLSRVHRWRLEQMEPPRFPARIYLDDLAIRETADAA